MAVTMTFTLSRTDAGRFRSTCDRCRTWQASWSARSLALWQRTHHCVPY